MTGPLRIFWGNDYASTSAEPTDDVGESTTGVCRHCGAPITWRLDSVQHGWLHGYDGANSGLKCHMIDVACLGIRGYVARKGIVALVDPTRMVDVFAGPYRALSNFGDPTLTTEPITIYLPWTGPMTAGQNENLYQAAKSDNLAERKRILAASPADAKVLGQRCSLIDGWDDRKYAVMEACIDAKFAPGRIETAALLLTRDAALVEGTWWNDRVWGVDLTDPDRPGRNLLGSMLMNRRALLNMRCNVEWAELVRLRDAP